MPWKRYHVLMQISFVLHVKCSSSSISYVQIIFVGFGEIEELHMVLRYKATAYYPPNHRNVVCGLKPLKFETPNAATSLEERREGERGERKGKERRVGSHEIDFMVMR